MAKPQLEKGYTQVANEILENIAKINLSAYEQRVLWSIIRLTYGWHRKSAPISLGMLRKITNLPPKKISAILKKLEFKLLIVVHRKSKGLIIAFQKDYELWRKATQLDYSKADLTLIKHKLCIICNEQNEPKKHHILPKEWGGSDTKENKVILCGLHHYRVHMWLKHTTFKNGQDLYNRFWEELRHPLFRGPFELDLSPEQVKKLSPIGVNKVSPNEGTIKYIKERKKENFFTKIRKEQQFWPQCQKCGTCYPSDYKDCPSCTKQPESPTSKFIRSYTTHLMTKQKAMPSKAELEERKQEYIRQCERMLK